MAAPNPVLEEAKRLERPCLYLRDTRSGTEPLVGYWGGPGVVPSPRGSWRHWISFSCGWLAKQGFDLKGCVSVYENDDRVVAVMDRDKRLPRTPQGDGLPLYGEAGRSWVPGVGVLAHGGEAFQRWWQGMQEKSEEERLTPVGDYDAVFQKHCPLYKPRSLKNVAAVIGGWHINWHDTRPLWKEKPGDEVASYRCGENRLALWTFRDAEPWIEVWQDRKGKLHAWGLIT